MQSRNNGQTYRPTYNGEFRPSGQSGPQAHSSTSPNRSRRFGPSRSTYDEKLSFDHGSSIARPRSSSRDRYWSSSSSSQARPRSSAVLPSAPSRKDSGLQPEDFAVNGSDLRSIIGRKHELFAPNVSKESVLQLYMHQVSVPEFVDELCKIQDANNGPSQSAKIMGTGPHAQLARLIARKTGSSAEQVESFSKKAIALSTPTPQGAKLQLLLPLKKHNIRRFLGITKTISQGIPLLLPENLMSGKLVTELRQAGRLFRVSAINRGDDTSQTTRAHTKLEAAGVPVQWIPLPKDIVHDVLAHASVEVDAEQPTRLEAYNAAAAKGDRDMIADLFADSAPNSTNAQPEVPPQPQPVLYQRTRWSEKTRRERMLLFLSWTAQRLALNGPAQGLPFVVVLSPLGNGLHNLPLLAQHYQLPIVCVASVEEFIILHHWIKMFCTANIPAL